MKNLLIVAAMLVTTFSASAQHNQKGPLASPRAFVKTDNVSISYGQPSKKGRDIFGGLVPYGQVWRAGANEATEITFKKNVLFDGKDLAAGTYTLFVTPSEKQWTIILNSQLKQWGSFDYEKIKDKDVLKAEVPVKKMEKVQEKLTYEMKKDMLVISWDKAMVSIPIVVQK